MSARQQLLLIPALHGGGLSPLPWRLPEPYNRQADACQPQEIPSTVCNRCSGRRLHGGTAQRCPPLHAIHPAHCGFFFSAEYCLRVARRMSLIARAAPVFLVSDFCLISVPFGYYDEPKILPYAISLICSIGADVRRQYFLRMNSQVNSTARISTKIFPYRLSIYLF